ncbi:MAG: galactofuranose transport system permease protein [Chthoniobacter sp.]|jgi:simple sugar transport system permease protein|nr:galactofuranose transport system permease protein [Chthoniobacter sp.]
MSLAGNLVFWAVYAAILFATRRQRIFWPLVALALLLLFNQLFTPGFFDLDVRDGHLYGARIDILHRGAAVMMLALGMTLVIATGGVDLSVGAIMAIAGAVMAQIAVAHGQSAPVAITGALAVALLAGAWNGLLVAGFGIQPIVATLILMVAGRGIAQLVSEGQIINFTEPALVFMGNGHFLGLPFTLTLVLILLAGFCALTRGTALGLFIESVGDNDTASRYSGVNARLVKFLAYLLTGLCAGIAGLVAASNIKGADANHAGLYFELDAILAVVVGGTALTGGRFYLVGSMVGALLIQTLTTTMYARNISADIAPVPKALVIIGVCLLQSEKARRTFARFLPKRRIPA